MFIFHSARPSVDSASTRTLGSTAQDGRGAQFQADRHKTKHFDTALKRQGAVGYGIIRSTQLLHGVAMIRTFSRLQSNLTGGQLIAITSVALLFNLWATELLNAAYAASGFPVPYWQAQLSFDHQKIKGWYSFLLGNQTLGLYVRTQLIDFIFIASVLILHTSALLAVSRSLPASSKGRQVLIWAALLSAFAPLSDAIENGISFVMLANPTSFEPFLALAYSSAAALKFGMFAFAYIAAIGGLFASLLYWINRAWRGESAA